MSGIYEFTASELATKFSSQIANKVILITGCSPGSLAASVAQTISSHGPALLILAGRARAALQETEKIILAQSPIVKIKLLILDLASHKSVREVAAEINNSPEQIDVLINSAGLMACPFEKTVDGIESQFAVNHLGHFLLTNLIMDKFPRGGRVLNVTSGGYQWTGVRYEDVNFEKQPYDRFQAYGQAKTANILFSQGLADRLGSRGIFSYSLTPGGVSSNFPVQIWTYDQGTATYITAAFGPEAEAYNGAFMEFCKPVPTEEECPWARGKDNVDKLWALSEKLVGEKFLYL